MLCNESCLPRFIMNLIFQGLIHEFSTATADQCLLTKKAVISAWRSKVLVRGSASDHHVKRAAGFTVHEQGGRVRHQSSVQYKARLPVASLQHMRIQYICQPLPAAQTPILSLFGHSSPICLGPSQREVSSYARGIHASLSDLCICRNQASSISSAVILQPRRMYDCTTRTGKREIASRWSQLKREGNAT